MKREKRKERKERKGQLRRGRKKQDKLMGQEKVIREGKRRKGKRKCEQNGWRGVKEYQNRIIKKIKKGRRKGREIYD